APLAGRVALVTGANTGIGRVTAIELARRGARVFIACRSAARAAPVLAELQAIDPGARLLELDLADFDAVRDCARRFLELGLPLHLLVNNAGLAGDRGLTRSGFERAFGVNHLGHFLLTTLLLERLQAAAPARIVNVASRAHVLASAPDWAALRRPTRSLTGVAEYGVSKLCNVLFSAELARRLRGRGVASYALHPGVVATEVWRHVPWPLRMLNRLRTIPDEAGALTTLHCATSDEAGRESGLYYDHGRPRLPSRLARDEALAAELWRRSEAWVG
ncbi:MAG: SDR family NAD(P)-dependent oxidoreductase, partial [Burkholderiales bacterium]|nr:SDR family NAD(P)-dependent oxidoreductase [Burkholderiales bacterium]